MSGHRQTVLRPETGEHEMAIVIDATEANDVGTARLRPNWRIPCRPRQLVTARCPTAAPFVVGLVYSG